MNRLLLLLSILLAGCADTWVLPYAPVTPPAPIVAPVDPVTPAPVLTVIPHETVAKVVAGMSHADLDALLGPPTLGPVRQDDGTALTRWLALDADGGPRWMIVHESADGHVLGLALIPRAE